MDDSFPQDRKVPMPDSITIQTDDSLPPVPDLQGNQKELETLAHKPSPFFFGLGTLGITVMGETFGAFAYFYYIDFLGLALGLAAMARTIYAIWDAVNDPLFSYLSDSTRTRWGRRRPWLLISVPFCALSFVAIFLVPASLRGQNSLFWYLLAAILLYETLLTIAGLNYNVLFPELFRTLPDRVRAGAFNRAGLILGLFIGLALTPLVYEQLGFQKMALLYAALAGSMLFIAALRHKEDPSYQNPVTLGLWPVFREVLKGRAFWLYAMTLAIFAFAVNLFPFAIPFYSKYSLGAEAGTTVLIFAASLAAALGSVPVWVKLYRRWGTASVFLRSMGVILIASIALGLAPGSVTAILAACLYGIGWGGCQVCFDVIRAGLVDRHYHLTGQRSEAVYFSLLGFGIHLSGVLQGAAMLAVGMLFGYVSGEQPGPQPDITFRFLIGVVPVISLVLSMYFARQFFNLTTHDPVSKPILRSD
jgi:GPH family glycoside/pentoside/hexuronide:cation symporter